MKSMLTLIVRDLLCRDIISPLLIDIYKISSKSYQFYLQLFCGIDAYNMLQTKTEIEILKDT